MRWQRSIEEGLRRVQGRRFLARLRSTCLDAMRLAIIVTIASKGNLIIDCTRDGESARLRACVVVQVVHGAAQVAVAAPMPT